MTAKHHLGHVVLLVDSEPSSSEKARDELGRSGVEVHLVDCVDDALLALAERAQTDELQRRNAERFEIIARHSFDVIAVVDLAGRFKYASEAVRTLYGEDPRALVGAAAFELVHPLDQSRLRESVRTALGSSQRTARVEYRRLRADGSYVWVESQGTLVSDPITQEPREILGITRDITAQKLANEALKKERAQLAEAQQLAHIGSWEWDISRDHLAWSAELYRIFGLDETSLTPSYQGFLATIHTEDRDRVDALVRKAMQDHKAYEYDMRVVRPSGEVRFIHARGRVLADENGRPQTMAGTAQDVTARKELDRRIVIADRMASVGTLAAGIAHEINNPLATVMANLEVLAQALRQRAQQSPDDDTRELEEAVADARDGAERVRKIVRGLRVFSRADDENRQTLNLHRVLDVSIALALNEVRHRAHLIKDFGAPPLVLADETRLAQVFVNLMVNAAQSIPEGMADRNEIRVLTRCTDDGRALVEVHDTGPGIPEHVRSRVFDPFFTTKPIGEGTGLGLSICHGIVASLGGEISFECPNAGGTVFRVVLPATTIEAERRTSSAPAAVSAGQRGRVLLVDDDLGILRALARGLGSEHDVVALSDAQQALQRLLDGDRFDVILCDLMMPSVTGMDLHTALLHAVPEQAQRMIFMSGGAFTSRGRSFLDEVPNQRIDKPFDMMNVRALVRAMVR